MKNTCLKITSLASRITAGLSLMSIMLASPPAVAQTGKHEALLLHAARVFDGHRMRTNTSIQIMNGKVAQIGPRGSFAPGNAKVVDLGDATILPGFIELHAHLSFQRVPADTVLKHGITTIRDVGGPVHKPYGGNGALRVLTSGPIITAPGGYPIPLTGEKNIAIPVSTEKEARETVRNLIDAGAVVIKIALEPGGEPGAPWSGGHVHGHHHDNHVAAHGHAHQEPPNHEPSSHEPRGDKPAKPAHSSHPHPNTPDTGSNPAWPLLPESIVKAIVNEAHANKRRVTAHIAETKGAEIAINAGVDEWAHIPCDIISEPLLKKAVSQGVKIVTTLDTLSKCPGVAHNARVWREKGGELLYGAEIAHPDVPRGIDAQELMFMMQMGNMETLEVLRAATSKAGEHLGLPLLGTLQAGAPADLIAVRGDPTHNLKNLEYPNLVISGGEIVLNDFPIISQPRATAGDR
ncbi:MAG: amidohydrolase family protein [Nitrosospira multiformis]|nr:amidohydrolase family protein [Nitrosospira multiformis]